MKVRNCFLRMGLAALSLSLLSGCAIGNQVGLVSQSHFDFPNSNVYPLGHVSGKSSLATFFTPPLITGDLKERAINDALAKNPEAELLVNYTENVKIITFLILPLYVMNYEVEGTAAKMTVGKQHLA